MSHILLPHPAHPPSAINSLGIIGRVDADIVTLTFTVEGAVPTVPRPAEPVRADGLWHTTCFELFVQPGLDNAYFEFNFSPSTRWAAYRFDAYRAGMVDLDLSAPLIEPVENGVRVTVDLSILPPPPWRVGLSAVIEETDGTKSYWALAHPPGKPDFHDPACFVLEVPARA